MAFTRSELFQKALNDCYKMAKKYPDLVVLISIQRQLQYLIEYEKGQIGASKLNQIILGIQAVREIEPLNLDFANMLYLISSEVEMMKNE